MGERDKWKTIDASQTTWEKIARGRGGGGGGGGSETR